MKQKKHFITFIFVCLTCLASAQTTVTGKVTDSKSKEALLGVLVVAEGTSIGTTTDLDGKYSISVPSTVKCSGSME